MIKLSTDKVGEEAYAELYKLCVIEKNKIKQTTQGKMKILFALTNEYADLYDYREITDFGFITHADITKKSAKKNSNLSCDYLSYSKSKAKIVLKKYYTATEAERRKEQDKEHGYPTSIEEYRLQNPKPIDNEFMKLRN